MAPHDMHHKRGDKDVIHVIYARWSYGAECQGNEIALQISARVAHASIIMLYTYVTGVAW